MIFGVQLVSHLCQILGIILFLLLITLVYLLKDLSHVPEVIKKLFIKIKTQFSTSPKLFRIDNALEFVQNDITILCSSSGILHQTSCSCTSQKNSVTKRRHRHVVDVTLAIMLQMFVPKYL